MEKKIGSLFQIETEINEESFNVNDINYQVFEIKYHPKRRTFRGYYLT